MFINALFVSSILLLQVHGNYFNRLQNIDPECISGHNRVLCEKINKQFNSVKLTSSLRSNQTAANAAHDEDYFEQKLNHFDPADKRRWRQRYQSSKAFSSGDDGPVFLMLGGEGPISPGWFKKGAFMAEMAEKYNGTMYQLEHRFYGKSQPFGNLELENLHYLTSEQALSDAANFIYTKRKSHKEKWIVLGGSYSGALAAWMRLKYPHLVYGSVASSAPVKPLTDFYQYFEVVEATLRTTRYGSVCIGGIKKVFAQLEEVLETEEGRKELEKRFHLCNPFPEKDQHLLALDKAAFSTAFADLFAGAVQYNNPADPQINKMCNSINQNIGSQWGFLDQMYKENYKMGTKCFDPSFKASNSQLANVTVQGGGAQRAWIWQTCNEFGYYQTVGKDSPFGTLINLNYYLETCRLVFGELLVETNVEEATGQYGARAVSDTATNIVFPNGSFDPWHVLSIQKEDKNSIFIKGTSHCADMRPIVATDPDSMKEARVKLANIVGNWIKN